MRSPEETPEIASTTFSQGLISLIVVVLLSACSVIPEQVPVDFYQLPPPTLETSNSPRLPALLIGRPLSSEALAGNRLLIMTEENQLQAYPGMRLAAPIPELWRDWLLDAYWRDGRVGALSAASQGLRSDLELTGFLRAFQVNNTNSQPRAVIQFDAHLIQTAGLEVIASRRFEAQQTMTSTEASSAITALGLAANRLAQDLIEWSVLEGSK